MENKKEEKMDFNLIIAKFLSQEISDEELLLLKTWLDQDPENRRIFDEENELWQATGTRTKIDHFNSDTAWIKISSKLGLGSSDQNNVTVLRKNQFRWLIAAASLACLIALGGFTLYLSLKSSIKNGSAIPMTSIVTKEGEKSHIYLSDSTKIFLNSGSTLEYDENYNKEDRVIKLIGEAYFEVHTNPSKPFIVKAGDVTVTATGTRFNVLSYDNENRIETTLEEGKIKVLANGKEPIDVSAGEQVVYTKNSKELEVHDVASNTFTSWTENKLKFYDTPFEEAMRGISRRYNVKIDITDRELLNLNYTATFIDESIEEVMQYLKNITPITYNIIYQTSIDDATYTKPKIVIGLLRNKL
jgi:transmembrane sensor